VVPIEFLDLLAPLDTGWAPLHVGTGSGDSPEPPGDGWLTSAPAAVTATLDGVAWRSSGIDASFGLEGIRLGGGAAVPRSSHDRALLLLVFGGAVTVHSIDADAVDEEHVELRAGQFCVVEADTTFRLAASAEGVTFLTSWPRRPSQQEPVARWEPIVAAEAP
jgi:mannose-6-phosphate isomerase-like protein (cupin superfamily)